MGVCIPFVDGQLEGLKKYDPKEPNERAFGHGGAVPPRSTGAAPLATEPCTKGTLSLPTGKS